MSYVSLAIFVGAGTAFVPIILAATQNGKIAEATNHLLIGQGWVVVLAGLLNGVGLVLFYRLIELAQSGSAEMGRMIPIVLAVMPLIIVVGGIILYGEQITLNKILGAGLIIAGVYVINR